MYTIYIDDNLLYSPNLAEEGYAVTAATVTTEINKAGSLEFTMPPSNPRYNDVNLLASVVSVQDDGTEIFRGRPIDISRDFYNNRKVHCEGWLACLLDSVVRPYNSSGSVEAKLRSYIASHNQQMVDQDKQFIVRTCTVTDPNNYIVRASSNYPTTWNEIEDKLINLLGGHIRYERRRGTGSMSDRYFNYIDYLADYDTTSNQIIEFGRNLLSIDEFITVEDLFTVFIPLGARDDETDTRLDIRSVNDGRDYIEDSGAITRFGRIWRVETYDDITIASNLKRKGEQVLADSISAAVSLEMKAFDLHLLDVDTDTLTDGDVVRVVSLPHGIDDYFVCRKVQRNLLRPDDSMFYFGAEYKTLTGQTRSQIRVINNELQSVITTPPLVEVFTRSPSGYLWGDANANGVVNSDDLDLIANYLVDSTLTIQIDAVDTTGDGQITNVDYLTMLRLINNLPSGKIITKVVTTFSDGTISVSWEYADNE